MGRQPDNRSGSVEARAGETAIDCVVLEPNAVPRSTLVAVMALACASFVASLCFPCIYTAPDGSPPFDGLSLCVMGPFGILGGIVAWYANPLLALMFVCLWMRQFRCVAILGIPSLTLALSTLAMQEMPVSSRVDYPVVTGYGAGFYLWIASMAIPMIAALHFLCRSKRAAATTPGFMRAVKTAG